MDLWSHILMYVMSDIHFVYLCYFISILLYILTLKSRLWFLMTQLCYWFCWSTSIVGGVLVLCLAGWLDRAAIGAFRWFIFMCYRQRLDVLRPAVAYEVGYVFEDDHPHPVWNLLIFHGVVVENVGNDDRLQKTDDHEGQTHWEIYTCMEEQFETLKDFRL